MIKIDVVCPLYKAENEIVGFLQRLKNQSGVQICKTVFPVTESEGWEETVKILEKSGCSWFLVKAEEFSHSLTREKALFEYCESDIVLMMSQDVIVENADSVLRLVERVNEEVAYAYGRQICKEKTIEYYVRKKNYGKVSETVEKDDIQRLQLRAFFSSDAFAAYYRPTFLTLNGYDHVPMMMSEDKYYSKKVLENGYKKAYVAEAVVEHSHKFTIRQLYRRYYQTGIWFGEHKEFDEYKTTDSGLKLAWYVFKNALKDFNIPVLFRFIPDMLARFLGMKKGKKSVK